MNAMERLLEALLRHIYWLPSREHSLPDNSDVAHTRKLCPLWDRVGDTEKTEKVSLKIHARLENEKKIPYVKLLKNF